MYQCPNVVFITKDQPSKLSGITKEQLLDRQPIGLPPSFVCWSCINTLGYMLPSIERERGALCCSMLSNIVHRHFETGEVSKGAPLQLIEGPSCAIQMAPGNLLRKNVRLIRPIYFRCFVLTVLLLKCLHVTTLQTNLFLFFLCVLCISCVFSV